MCEAHFIFRRNISYHEVIFHLPTKEANFIAKAWTSSRLLHGANEGNRTHDLFITSEPLYRLSYVGKY